MELTREQRLHQLQHAEAEAARLRKELGIGKKDVDGVEGDIKSRLDAEEGDAALFDRLSGEDMVRLSTEDPEKWQRVVEAKRNAGERKLFERSQ